MANVIFCAQDLSLYTLSATSTDANFPLTNLQTYYASDQWKSASTAGAQSIVIDFGAAKACDFVILDNYTFGNADLVILEAATDSAFTTGLVTALAGGNFYTGVEPGIEYFSFSSQTKRYWRLRTTLASGSLASVPAIGNWYLGAKVDFGVPYAYPYKDAPRKHRVNSAEMLDGKIRTTFPYKGRKYWEFRIDQIADAIKTSYSNLVYTTVGSARPFYFIDADGTTVSFVHFDSDQEDTESMKFNFNTTGQIILKSQLVG